MADNDRADWQGVGASFRTLGMRLKEHAVDAGDAMRSARTQTAGGPVDEVTNALKAAMAKIDETSTDPDVAAAAKDATARLLDAVKAELTGEGRTEPAPGPTADAPPDEAPPKPVESGPAA